jgi:hypothetical protein
MTDLNEMATEHRKSDTSLMNFISNHVTSVTRPTGSSSWVATSRDYIGYGDSIRECLQDLYNREVLGHGV